MFGKKDPNKKILSRDEMLNAQDETIEEVYVSPWQGYVYVKSLSGKERDKYESDIVEWKGKGRNTKAEMKDNIRARLVALAVIDPETKKPIFSTNDVEALGNKNSSAIDTIFEAARRLSKISEDDIEELAEGKSETETQDSTSNSPES